MKMTRTAYNMLLRFVAGIAASLILVGAVALLGQRTAKNLFQAASGVDTDRIVMTVDGQDISAEEYLYWLSYYCDYYNQYLSYVGITDWNTELEEGYTAGDYIVQQGELQALSMVTQYAVIDNWAKSADIVLTDADLADISAQRDASVKQLGGEAAYQKWLQSLGISDDFIARSLGHSYLINHLSDAYHTTGSAVYPGEERLNTYMDTHEFFGASILFIDTCEMSEEDKADALAEMEDHVTKLREASDLDAAFAKMAEIMGVDPSVVTFTADDMEEGFISELKKVDIDAVSDVISTDEGYYVAIRKQPAMTSILDGLLNEEFAERCANAEITYNDDVYGAINTLTFYKKLLAARGTPVA